MIDGSRSVRMSAPLVVIVAKVPEASGAFAWRRLDHMQAAVNTLPHGQGIATVSQPTKGDALIALSPILGLERLALHVW